MSSDFDLVTFKGAIVVLGQKFALGKVAITGTVANKVTDTMERLRFFGNHAVGEHGDIQEEVLNANKRAIEVGRGFIVSKGCMVKETETKVVWIVTYLPGAPWQPRSLLCVERELPLFMKIASEQMGNLPRSPKNVEEN